MIKKKRESVVVVGVVGGALKTGCHFLTVYYCNFHFRGQSVAKIAINHTLRAWNLRVHTPAHDVAPAIHIIYSGLIINMSTGLAV